MTRSVKHKTKNWKRYQIDSQVRKKVVLGVLALGFLLAVVIFGRTLDFLGAVSRSASWDGSSNLNVVLIASDLTLLSYHPAQSKLSLIKIPEPTTLNVGSSYGAWQAGSVYQLGESESPGVGGELLKIALINTLATPVDGYLKFSGGMKELSGEEIVSQLREDPTKLATIIGSSETDLSLVELVTWLWGVRGVRFDKVEVLDLQSSQATSWKVLSDGTRVLTVSPSILDSLVGSLFEEDAITSERQSIAVFNSTPKAGLADSAARLISNIGGRVVLTDTTRPQLDKTLVLGPGNSRTLQRLKQIFSPNCQEGKVLWVVVQHPCAKLAEGIDLSLNGAEITIILGQDLAKP